MNLRQAAQQALEALKDYKRSDDDRVSIALHILHQALAEPEQEPVAHLWQHSETGRTRVVMPDQVITADATWFVVGPLYLGTAPTPRKPLSEQELDAMRQADGGALNFVTLRAFRVVARAVERAHGIGEQT